MDETGPPRQPRYVFRGHASAIHALAFSPDNSRLLTGDADGWVVSWVLAYRRPAAVWRAHGNAVLGLSWWGPEAVISHGRDSKLVVWQLGQQDEKAQDKTLPVDEAVSENRKPTVLYELTVNTMNFCSFASCTDPLLYEAAENLPSGQRALMVALPHTLDSEAIDIFQLPSTNRLSTIPAPKLFQSGMAMALHARADTENTCVVAGYESGHVAYYLNSSRKAATNTQASRSARPAIYTDDWNCIYLSKPHSQPILSLVASLDEQYLASSGADSVIATHLFLPVIESSRDQDEEVHGVHAIEEPHNTLKTGHPGQQGLSVSGTGAMFASAGWDGVVRVYTWGVIKERETLEWHRDGVYATAFAHALDEGSIDSSMTDSSEGAVAQRQGTLAARRERQAKLTPWLVVGGKDGKVSLWDMGA